MDAAWVSAANDAITAFRADPELCKKFSNSASEVWNEPGCSAALLPAAQDPEGGPLLEERMNGLEALPTPFCAPFRKMIACPSVISRLLWMMGGPGWSDIPAKVSVSRPGSGGQALHGDWSPASRSTDMFSAASEHSLQSASVNYQFTLRDVGAADGGL